MYKFYIEMDGDQFGPYSATQIKEFDLLPDIMVRQEGSTFWQRADAYNFNSLANDEFIESLNIGIPNERSTIQGASRISFRDSVNYESNTDSIAPYSSQVNTHTESSHGTLLQCPECGRLSDSLKCFTLPNYAVFIGIYAQWQNVQYICCPSCMRKHIGVKCFTYNIVLANIMWPIFILPWGVTQLIRSSQKGHTTTVKNLYNV